MNKVGAINTLYISGLWAAIRAKEEKVSEEESQYSYFLNFNNIDKLILGDNNSISTLYTPNRLANL